MFETSIAGMPTLCLDSLFELSDPRYFRRNRPRPARGVIQAPGGRDDAVVAGGRRNRGRGVPASQRSLARTAKRQPSTHLPASELLSDVYASSAVHSFSWRTLYCLR